MTKPLIVFDLDGTLIDSAPDLHHALIETFDRLGRAKPDLKTTISYVGNGAGMLIRRALAAAGGASKDEEGEALRMFLDAYHRAGVTRTRLYPGVSAVLSALNQAGATLAICTNKPQGPALEVCSALGLSDNMTLIFGARPDFPRKPKPDPLLHVAAELGTRPEQTVFVGDSVVDHETAAAVGIAFAFFTGGYLNGTLPPPEPDLSFEDWRRLDPSDLIKLAG